MTRTAHIASAFALVGVAALHAESALAAPTTRTTSSPSAPLATSGARTTSIWKPIVWRIW